MIEQASPAHVATDMGGAVYYSVAAEDGSASVVEPSGSGPELPGAPAAPSHHCCAAHTGSLAPILNASTISFKSDVAPIARDAQRAPQNAPMGLDRPPKASALV